MKVKIKTNIIFNSKKKHLNVYFNIYTDMFLLPIYGAAKK